MNQKTGDIFIYLKLTRQSVHGHRYKRASLQVMAGNDHHRYAYAKWNYSISSIAESLEKLLIRPHIVIQSMAFWRSVKYNQIRYIS